MKIIDRVRVAVKHATLILTKKGRKKGRVLRLCDFYLEHHLWQTIKNIS